jgi:hypothetical protein
MLYLSFESPFAETGHDTWTTELNSSGNVIVLMTKQLRHNEASLILEQGSDTGNLAVIRNVLWHRPALIYEQAYFQNKNSHVVNFVCFMHFFYKLNPQKINVWGASRVSFPKYLISDIIARILLKRSHSWVYSGSCGTNLILIWFWDKLFVWSTFRILIDFSHKEFIVQKRVHNREYK